MFHMHAHVPNINLTLLLLYLIKLVTKIDDEHFESNLKQFYFYRLNYMLVQDELTTREQVIHQNNLIMQWED